MTRGEVPNPVFLPREVIHLQGQLDDDVGMVAARLLDGGDILIEVGRLHAPVVEVVARHGAVVGKAHLLETKPDGLRCQFCRLPGGMVAQRRV